VNHPELMLSCINPVLCIERVAKLLHINLNMAVFQDFSRQYPTGHAIFITEDNQAPSLPLLVASSMKIAAASFSNSAPGVERLATMTHDIVTSTTVVLKSHCPVEQCRAVAVLLENRVLVLSAAGLMSPSSTLFSYAKTESPPQEVNSQRSVCDDAFRKGRCSQQFRCLRSCAYFLK
jgi:hypothetical protein